MRNEISPANCLAVSPSTYILGIILRKHPGYELFSPGRVRAFPNSFPAEEQGQFFYDQLSPL
jgi:hypothetical protein